MAKKASVSPRWYYRFQNYSKAYLLLQEAITSLQNKGLNQLELEGLIQRFEFTWELSWKLLKDYLEGQGVVLSIVTPSSVIKAAYAANLITKADDLLEALDARNKMSHTYDNEVFQEVIQEIENKYFAALSEIHSRFLAEYQNG